MGGIYTPFDMKQLVAYYSRTGTTRKVAEAIVEVLKCDVEEIRDLKNRAGVLGWLSSGMDATLKRLTEIEELQKPPENYSVTIIGTPVWNNTVSTPIRTYIVKYGNRFKQVAFFCTQYSSKSNALKDMEVLCGKKPVATLMLSRRQVESGEYVSETKKFYAQTTQ
ncbi:MAG: flavodoxin [Thermoproteota archaeon]